VSDRTDAAHQQAPLSIETDLTLTIDGAQADVRSTGERLFVEFASLPAAVRALRGTPLSRSDDLTELLSTTDLTVEVRARGRTLAVIGSDARAGILSRQVDVDPVELRLGGVLAAVGQELSAGVRRVRRLLP
jgi:hypothetical protein